MTQATQSQRLVKLVTYAFSATGTVANWDQDESLEAFLFTSAVDVDADITESDLNKVASSTIQPGPNDALWTLNKFTYVTSSLDIGKTLYFGFDFQNRGGTVFAPSAAC
ncbi:MAG: hypothetical protein ACSHYA_09270 [Opitutaceae bacterium]